MIIENPEIFRLWLSTVLEPLCDADPAALAKYVYALVKKDKPVNDLRVSMIEQLDVFLQEETQSFVALLFKTIENKEYLNVKKDSVKEEKKTEDSKPVPPTATQSTEPEKEKTKELNKTEEKENEDYISSTDEKPNGVQIQSSVVSEGPVKPIDGEGKLSEGKEDRRKDSERDERNRFGRNRNRKENSIPRNQRSRSRSWDRLRRSRSRDRERVREKDRLRLYRNKSPPRRYDRGFDRRRTYSRSPSPLRYRIIYPTRSKSKSRSPKTSHRGRFRNRSPSLSRSRSPRSRSRSRSYDRKNLSGGRDDTPTQDNNHGDVDMRLQQAPHSGNENDCDRYSSKIRRCRDYDEKGYCLRGELCLYDHGTDPVVLEDVALSQVLTYGPQGPHDVPLAPPNVPCPLIHDIVPPMGMPPPVGMDQCPIGPPPPMLIQCPLPVMRPPLPNMEYSPNAPGMNANMNWGRPGFRGLPRPMHPGHPPGAMGFNPGQRSLINVPVESNSHSLHKQNNVVAENHADRRGGFDPNRQYSNSTLILKKVPPGLNNITHLNNHFAKFGKIVNIQVNYENDPESAMIIFSNPAEANAAIKSTEAVLNNRFIKVFWHKDGAKQNHGKGIQAAPATNISSNNTPTDGTADASGEGVAKKQTATEGAKEETPLTPEEKKAKTIAAIKKSQEIIEKNKLLRKKTEEKRKEALKLTSDLRKRTQNLLEKQIEQQKALIKKLELGNLDEKQKKEIKDTIKTLQESIEKIKQELLEKTTKTAKKMMPVKKTKEEIQKEILDTELDLISKQQEGGNVLSLQKKIASLKIELIRVQQPKLGNSRILSRGSHKTSLMKNMSINRNRTSKINSHKSAVDHRPTKILVSGYENDEKDLVLTHFRQFGEIGDYIADDSIPSIVLNYRTRQEAEIAMVKGKSFQDRLLTVTWFTTNVNSQFRSLSTSGRQMNEDRNKVKNSKELLNDSAYQDVNVPRNSSAGGPTYHMHAGRQLLLSGSETNLEQETTLENDESEIDHGLESSEDFLLQDDDEDLEDEERSWRR